ncbi:MAG: hypothetical protein QE285_06600 [Aquabacterium sp.]|nr:hypothetical protein [Aquabacterium sp.]
MVWPILPADWLLNPSGAMQAVVNEGATQQVHGHGMPRPPLQHGYALEVQPVQAEDHGAQCHSTCALLDEVP